MTVRPLSTNWVTGLTALAIVVWIVLFDRVKGLRKPEMAARSLLYDLLGTASVPLLVALVALMPFALRTLALRPEMRQKAGLPGRSAPSDRGRGTRSSRRSTATATTPRTTG
ncbi:hypothetical protein [Streptomyces sp. bgisy034]|uniref:hypothetical protein n=1 Tax=Streptomyces sp. bgisy034 TaxID=3413774 RepID=UPI003EBAFB5F